MNKNDRFFNALSEDRRYRLLVDAVTDYAIYMLDREGFIASWNSGARRFKGYEESEILGEHYSRFYSAEDRAKGLPQINLEIAVREGRFESEGWRVRKDGSRFWAHVVLDPIRDPLGDVIGFAKITRDLTERKQAEQALKRSEQQFRLLVNGVTDYAIYMLSTEGFVTSWNVGAERIKQYRPHEIIGQHFSKFYTEEDLATKEPAKALECAATQGRYEKEGWRIRKDGSRFWANVVLDSIRDDTGVIIGYAKITRDITERRNTERALEQAREELFQSQKMDAIGQLTGGVAHDFNNLLMAILGSLEIVRRRMPEETQVLKFVDNAIEAAHRGAVLTQRMLAFARRQQLNAASVNVADLVEGMKSLLQSSLGPGVMVTTRFPHKLSMVRADSNQLELALLNLAVNARDAMPKGGTIVIEGREDQIFNGPKTGRYVCISVRDTGHGMDEATLSRAMEPFFTTKGVGKGTGLGLSMVHGLVEQLGGMLTIQSRIDEGTTVEAWLPVIDSRTHSDSDNSSKQTSADASNGPLTILAVDDDPLVLLNTVAMLEELGHSVLEAGSAIKALEILQQNKRIDLIITDQAMPHMTGVELARKVRAEHAGLPIIVATGYAELPSDAPRDLRRLSKPFRQQDLEDAIAALPDINRSI
jgi:PAS domain S-box-containing protein